MAFMLTINYPYLMVSIIIFNLIKRHLIIFSVEFFIVLFNPFPFSLFSKEPHQDCVVKKNGYIRAIIEKKYHLKVIDIYE